MSRKEQHHTRQARAKHRDQERRKARRDKCTRRRFELGAAVAAVVLVCLSATTTAHAKYDPFDVWGYVAYTPPAATATTTTTTTTPIIDYALPAAACVETSAHPCGHRAGADTIAAACGDPTCGMRDDPKLCNGASPCYFCCCGCDGGCGTGDHEPEAAACVPDWSPGMPGRPCTK